MTGLLSSAAGGILRPEDVGALVVQPLMQASVALRVSTVVETASPELRVPIVTADPAASWVLEGNSISESDPTVSELVITPKKLAGLTIVSHELAMDSSPAALGVVGNGLVRDLARKIDAAFFANTTTNAPNGIKSVTITVPTIADTDWVDLDAFTAAQYTVEQHNGHIGYWVTSPADAIKLGNLKTFTGTDADSNTPLLGTDATMPGVRTILGAPLLTSPYVDVGTVYGFDTASSLFVLREGTAVDVDGSAFFQTDQLAVRARLRASWGWPNPLAQAKLVLAS